MLRPPAVGSLLAAATVLAVVLGQPELAAAQVPDPSAEPSRERAQSAIWVIPPGREGEARALLEPAYDAGAEGLSWRGPQIEVDRIKWWLMAGDEARAMLTLVPAPLGSDAAPRSRSFALELGWAEGASPSAAEQAMIEAAIAAVQANDAGDFYGIAVDNALAEGVPVEYDGQHRAPTLSDPAQVRRVWWLRVVGVGLLGLLGLGVALRGLYAQPRPS